MTKDDMLLVSAALNAVGEPELAAEWAEQADE